MPRKELNVDPVVSAEFWAWFDSHQDDEVYRVRVWIVSKTIRVRDLRPLFVKLFGEHP